MTTDIAVLERALIVMAVCLVIQTLLFVATGVGAFIAWRRASAALLDEGRSGGPSCRVARTPHPYLRHR